MVIKRGVSRLKPRQMGVALETIEEGKFGSALFEKVPGSNEYYEFEVKALEYIRENHEVWVIDSNNGITEHTPQELKFEDVLGVPHRVSDRIPLPCGGGEAEPKTVTATASGNTVVLAPSSGKKLRVKYIFIFNNGAGSLTVGLRFTETGDLHFSANLSGQTGHSENLTGCHWIGGADESLYVNLSGVGDVTVTVMYDEVS